MYEDNVVVVRDEEAGWMWSARRSTGRAWRDDSTRRASDANTVEQTSEPTEQRRSGPAWIKAPDEGVAIRCRGVDDRSFAGLHAPILFPGFEEAHATITRSAS